MPSILIQRLFFRPAICSNSIQFQPIFPVYNLPMLPLPTLPPQPLQPPQPPEPPQPPLPPQPPQPPQPPLPKLPPQLAIPFITPIQHPQPLKKKVRGVRKEPLLQTAPYGPTVQVTAYKGAQDSAPNSTPDPAAIPWASSTVPAAQQPCPAGHGHAPQPAAAPQDKALILPKLAEDRGEWSLPAGYKASLFRLLEMLPLSPQRLERAKSQLQAHLDAQRQLQNEVILPGYAWLLAAVSSKDASSILACLRRKFHIEL